MSLETLTGSVYIDALVATNPAAGDLISQGDDHIRGIKNVLKNSFPSITGAVTLTHTQLNEAARLSASNVFTGPTQTISSLVVSTITGNTAAFSGGLTGTTAGFSSDITSTGGNIFSTAGRLEVNGSLTSGGRAFYGPLLMRIAAAGTITSQNGTATINGGHTTGIYIITHGFGTDSYAISVVCDQFTGAPMTANVTAQDGTSFTIHTSLTAAAEAKRDVALNIIAIPWA